jgi:hypothetical protein
VIGRDVYKAGFAVPGRVKPSDGVPAVYVFERYARAEEGLPDVVDRSVGLLQNRMPGFAVPQIDELYSGRFSVEVQLEIVVRENLFEGRPLEGVRPWTKTAGGVPDDWPGL